MFINNFSTGSRKKGSYLAVRILREGGGGVKAWPLRKIIFFSARKKNSGNFFVATKLEGGGKALMPMATKKKRIYFCGFPKVVLKDATSDLNFRLCELYCGILIGLFFTKGPITSLTEKLYILWKSGIKGIKTRQGCT